MIEDVIFDLALIHPIDIVDSESAVVGEGRVCPALADISVINRTPGYIGDIREVIVADIEPVPDAVAIDAALAGIDVFDGVVPDRDVRLRIADAALRSDEAAAIKNEPCDDDIISINVGPVVVVGNLDDRLPLILRLQRTKARYM